MTVPGGTGMTRFSADLPNLLLPPPPLPSSAAKLVVKRNAFSELSVGRTCRITSPPLPPSPPAGPPRGMYFSRRHATAPLPPSPAFTRILTSSTNFIGAPTQERRGPPGPAALSCDVRRALGLGDDG